MPLRYNLIDDHFTDISFVFCYRFVRVLTFLTLPCCDKMLAKKVDTLNKAMEVESKRMRREFAVMEKEVATMRGDKELDNRTRRLSALRGAVNCGKPNPAR